MEERMWLSIGSFWNEKVDMKRYTSKTSSEFFEDVASLGINELTNNDTT
jgi:hypothetical protein